MKSASPTTKSNPRITAFCSCGMDGWSPVANRCGALSVRTGPLYLSLRVAAKREVAIARAGIAVTLNGRGELDEAANL